MANYDISLNGEWLFHSGDFTQKQKMAGAEYHASSKTGGALRHLYNFDDKSLWKKVTLPHDWMTEIPIDKDADATAGCKRRGVAWYRKSFSLPDEEIESAELVFDGVLGECQLFVNGVLAKRNFSGYNRFTAEISDYLLSGTENEITVFVDARRHEGWWYEGAGIYRQVKLLIRKFSHILRENCFVHTEGDTVVADLRFIEKGNIRASLTDKSGAILAFACESGNGSVLLKMKVDSRKRWSPESPELYTLHVALEQDDKEIDQVEFAVGFRDIEWTGDKGMLLDGKPYRLKGICAHQDHAGLGSALCEDVEEYRIMKLKALGANAYRSAHHAPSESLLNICDRLGMLVLVENRHFDICEDTLSQLDALVKLSRNHPCVFAYCLFNEEPWQSEKRGMRITSKLRDRIRALDDTRAVTAAQNGGVLLRCNASEALDIVGINYNLDSYESRHALSPEKPIMGTENSPTFATRGVYMTNREQQIFCDDGSEYPTNFSQPLYETMESVQKYPFVAGCFVWSGFDHRGEPNPFEYPSVSSQWGFLDNCGFDKNISNLLRAYYLDEPFLRFATFASEPSEGSKRTIVFTNADFCELFVGGTSLGKKKVINRTVEWNVPANEKNICVTADINGKVLCKKYPFFGRKSRLLVTDENPRMENASVRILNVSIVDENGNTVLSENGELKIDGKILAVGNGNPNGHQNDRADKINLFNGMAQVITPINQEIVLTYDGLDACIIRTD